MSATLDTTPADDPTSASGSAADANVGALADRLFQAGVATIDLLTVYLGLRLGLYQALHDHGSCTEDELAAATGISRRATPGNGWSSRP